jgi:hypothetical protein
MDLQLNLNKEPVFLNEVVYDGQTEQGVEFDYVLPDYYPDIFKVLKCTLTPAIISHSVSGSQLFCDGVVYIKVLYLTAGSNRIYCIEQRYTYSKTIDLVKNAPVDSAVVTVSPKTDYCNCRATSGRRIDVRGAVSCKIKVNCARKTEMITGAEGLGVETKKTALSYCGEKLMTSRQFVSREDIETGASVSGAISIIHHDANIAVTDFKVIANKIIVKGEAQIKALYIIGSSDSDNGDDGNITEVMEATIPVSQIMDLEGVTENHICFVNLSVMDCDLEVRPGEAGETRIFACDLTLDCTVTAHLESNVSPVSDIYSTEFESSFTVATIKAEALPHMISHQLSLRSAIENTEGNLVEIFDARCEVINVVCRARGTNEMTITGQITMQAIGVLDSGMPTFIEKSEPFELAVEVPMLGSEYSIEPNLQVTQVTYTLNDNKVDIRVSLSLNACLYMINSINVIRDITVNQEKPKDKSAEYALKLYYAEDGEDIWGIAKRYNTSADAIITENDLEGDRVEIPSMLLIPIV